MNKWIVIGGILVLVALGFLFFSGVNGNVINGGVVGVKMENEIFRISDFGSGNVELNSTEVKNGEGGSR